MFKNVPWWSFWINFGLSRVRLQNNVIGCWILYFNNNILKHSSCFKPWLLIASISVKNLFLRSFWQFYLEDGNSLIWMDLSKMFAHVRLQAVSLSISTPKSFFTACNRTWAFMDIFGMFANICPSQTLLWAEFTKICFLQNFWRRGWFKIVIIFIEMKIINFQFFSWNCFFRQFRPKNTFLLKPNHDFWWKWPKITERFRTLAE